MSDSRIPVLKAPATERCQSLKKRFFEVFHSEPEFYVRVPGRVNLIGEHIDYCGYGVCPMALRQDVHVAVQRLSGASTLQIHNVDEAYKSHECSMRDVEIALSEGPPDWYQYFLCGVRGILDVLPEGSEVRGLRVLVCGNVPQSAGLLSSSALVSAAALSTAYAHDLSLTKEEIADICAKCERYIGTQGGGMDQAIAFLATEGCAKLINFNPLRSEDVSLPPGAVFVIAHSLVRMNKAATADFNCRVIECRIAAQVLAKRSGLEWKEVRKLAELQEKLGVDLKSMVSIVVKYLHEQPYSREEILGELQTDAETLEKISMTENTRHVRSFKLFQRALHVFQEALRVQTFHEVCKEGGEGALAALGSLMSQSHESLSRLYECSHEQLDGLVDASRGRTLGCRLTGAGWGGCAVALLEPENVAEYIRHLKDGFYKDLGVQDGFDAIVFATEPNSGACVYVE